MEWFRNKVDQIQDKWDERFNPIEEEEDQTLLQQFNEATTLTRTQRFLGAGVCFSMGMLLSLMAPTFILRPVKLATTLTLGNLLSIGSMMFLAGPAKQCASMMDEKRRVSTLIYLVSLVATLLAAFLVKSRLLCLLCIATQYCAMAWYSLSYIPMGQAFALRLLGRGGAAAAAGAGEV